MLNRVPRPRLSYANVMVTLLMFVVLGGGAYATHGHKTGTKDLRDQAVTTPKLAAGAVTTPKLGNNAVNRAKVANSAIIAPKLADGAVSEAKLDGALEQRIAVLEDELSAQATTVSGLESRVGTLEGLLAGVSRGTIGGRDTLRFSAMNLQVVNGTNSTDGTPNGLGNVIVGYNAPRPFLNPRNGSHYVVIGDFHEWTAFGGLVAGLFNNATGNWASVSGGHDNTASGQQASVSGGDQNVASGLRASVAGGYRNTASGLRSTILGGTENTVSAAEACYPSC